MRRRDFILAAAAVGAWSPVAGAQPPRLTLGYLSGRSREGSQKVLPAFHAGLRDAGFSAGRDLLIEYRWSDGDYARLPGLASDLVQRQVNIVVAVGGSPAALAAQEATKSIPIVFLSGADPVQAGLVSRLNAPGRNMTGVSILAAELVPKRAELLRATVPNARSIAILINPTSSLARTLERQIPTISNSLGSELPVLYASQPAHFETAIGDMRRHNAEALVISSDAFFDSHSEWLAGLTVRNKIPAIHQVPEFATAGGLMSFGGSLVEAYRQVGVYAGRILKGEAAGELPVQQSARVHFAINIRTAKMFGINMPASLTALADEVIE